MSAHWPVNERNRDVTTTIASVSFLLEAVQTALTPMHI